MSGAGQSDAKLIKAMFASTLCLCIVVFMLPAGHWLYESFFAMYVRWGVPEDLVRVACSFVAMVFYPSCALGSCVGLMLWGFS